MALETKTTWARLRVGLMAIVALVILGVLVYLLSGSAGLFKSHVLLYTFFNNSGAIAAGSPVRLNGILIGKVTHVDLTGSNAPGRVVKLTLEVDSDFIPQIPDDSQSETAQLNLLGTKYVNIAKGKSSRPIQPGAEIKSAETAELQDWLKQGNVLIGGMQDILAKVNVLLADIQSGKGSIGKLLVDETLYNKIISITDQVQKLTETLNSNRGIGKLINDEALYNDVRGTVARINNLMDGIDQGQGTIGKFIKDPALYDQGVGAIADTRKAIANIDKLIAGLEAGEGSAGKLLKSNELHDQIKGTIGRLDSMLDKINNGQGTLGQLLVNPSLYESLDGTTREMNGLMKDFRKNPKKFLTIQLKLF
jgi:phospholipid/cholesterol/gamma-HCH transport system substrate-binding protein